MDYTDLSFQSFETKSEADNVATFTGIASTNDIDLHGDIIEAGAFGKSIKNIPLLRDHLQSNLIGRADYEQDGKSLKVTGEILLDDDVPMGRATYKLMKRGFLTGISVGFKPRPGGVIYDEAKDIRVIKKADLLEGSIVTIPANQRARIRSVKQAGVLLSADAMRDWLDANGFDAREIDILMTKGFNALLGDVADLPRFLPKREPALAGQGSDDSVVLASTLADEMRGLLKALSTEGRSHA